jgi:putative tryptophan/tyrosine transport system substrate-binding protein
MQRREFITFLGGAIAWPLAAHGQQSTRPVVGYLHSATSDTAAHFVVAFRNGLKESGYVEGQNVTVEYRFAEGQYDRLAALAADLVQRKVAVIVASGGDPPALAAKAASATIPIVFISSSDPVKLGLVASLNRPGGNATGVNVFTSMMAAKRLELLRELVPQDAVLAALVNPGSPSAVTQSEDLQEAARVSKQKLIVLKASTESDIDLAFATLVQQRAAALLVDTDAFFLNRRNQFSALAAHHRIPTIYAQREFVVAGGLMSYGVSLADMNRQLGVYVGRVLKGEKPADLPVQQPTKFEFVVNLITAKVLDLEIPAKLLVLADEVIE